MDLVQKVLVRMLLAGLTLSAITVTVNATSPTQAPSTNACPAEVSEGQDLHFCCYGPGCR